MWMGGREKHQRERHTDWLPPTCALTRAWGSNLKPWYVPLTGNQSYNPLVCGLMLYPLSHMGQGSLSLFFSPQILVKCHSKKTHHLSNPAKVCTPSSGDRWAPPILPLIHASGRESMETVWAYRHNSEEGVLHMPPSKHTDPMA